MYVDDVLLDRPNPRFNVDGVLLGTEIAPTCVPSTMYRRHIAILCLLVSIF